MDSRESVGLPRPSAGRERLLLLAATCAALIALLFWIASIWADARAESRAQAVAQKAATSRASLLVSELQTYRLLPIVLAEQPDLHSALVHPDKAVLTAANAKLERLADLIGAPIIYLLDAGGRTVAASNWRMPSSFVGQDYSFRPYFTRAWKQGTAEFFGLGTVSHEPGLFLSRRVGPRGPGGGVIVVKFGFDAVEKGWGPPPGIVYVTGADGVVLLTNRPDWRFRTTRPLPSALLANMRHTRQFGDAPLSLLALRRQGGDLVSLPGNRLGRREDFVRVSLPVPVAGWRLSVLEPLAPIRAEYLATARLFAAAGAILIVVAALAWLRARERRETAASTRAELERQVTARTAELEAAQIRFRQSREELAHANRLGSIGQITATVAHEINQPVAAIRAFAENGTELLRRGQADIAGDNLGHIAKLTARIGVITAELRSYARRGSGPVQPTALDAAIDGALLLVGHQLQERGIGVSRDGAQRLTVRADRIRLEQILVNLFHNAVEALAETPAPAVTLHVEADGPVAHLTFRDNGPGVAHAIRDRLFAPFATSKQAGLGLGLGIARDIAREFGGDLDLLPDRPGAAFLLTLRLA